MVDLWQAMCPARLLPPGMPCMPGSGLTGQNCLELLPDFSLVKWSVDSVQNLKNVYLQNRVNSSYYCRVIMASGESKMSQSTGSQWSSKSCAECVTNMRKHVFEIHLLYFWNLCSACFTCKEQLGSILHLMKIYLDVHPADEYQFQNLCDYMGRVLSWELRQSTELTSLLNFVVEKQLYPEYNLQWIDFTPTKLSLMVPFQKIWEEENVDPQVSPPTILACNCQIVSTITQ